MKHLSDIYFVRHGETDWNAVGRFQGQTDIPLNEKGRRQAVETGLRLRQILGEKTALPLIVSPLLRATETAQLIQQSVSFERSWVEPRLREISFGEFEGMTKAEILEAYPELRMRIETQGISCCASKGEAFEAVCARLTSWLSELTEPVVCVSHGAISRILCAMYMGVSFEESRKFDIPNGVIWRFSNGAMSAV